MPGQFTGGGHMTDSSCSTCTIRVQVVFFDNEKDNRPKAEVLSWSDHKTHLNQFAVRDVKSGPAWSPVRYKDGASRGNAGVEEVYLAVMDVDDGTDPEITHRRLNELGFEHVIHSTHSSTPEHPKFRVIVPLATPCSAADWPGFFPRLCTLLTGGHTDPGTKDPARMYFLPSARPGGKTFTYSGHGRPVSLADLPPALEPPTGAPPAPAVQVPTDIDGNIPHGRHHEVIVSTAASLAARIAGISVTALIEAMNGALAPLVDDLPKHEGEIAKAARSAVGKYGKPEPEGARRPVGDEPKAERTSAATRLVRAARNRAFLFHDAEGECYATLTVGGHEETHRIKSTTMRRWLCNIHYIESESAPTGEALAAAILTLEAAAQHEGPEIETHLRVAKHNGALWIDLGDPEWRGVRVTGDGWTVETESPVKFIRGRSAFAYPEPVRGGSLAELAPFLNAPGPTTPHFVLSVGWLIGTFHPKGPYPLLVIHGEQGAGKSVGSRFLRHLADPSANEVRSLPRNERDLAVAARGARVLAFDNASKIPDAMSDAICGLSTGGGFGTRELYTDGEEVVFRGKRPVLINGIPVVVMAADLRDRAIVVEWPVPSGFRQKESVLTPAFGKLVPRLFGAILDALVLAVCRNGEMEPRSDLRMVDFAAWVMAAEPALPWAAGTFERLYHEARDGLAIEAVSSSILAEAVRKRVVAARSKGRRRSSSGTSATTPTPASKQESPSHSAGRGARKRLGTNSAGSSPISERPGFRSSSRG